VLEIQTIPKHGYRLIAEVSEPPASDPAPSKALKWRHWAALAAGVLLIVLLWAVVGRHPSRESLAPEVREAYLKGRFFWKQRTRQGLDFVVSLLDLRAVRQN